MELKKEINRRRQIEEELEIHRDHLEELVTQRTKALHKSEERFRLLFENAKDGIFWANPKTGIIIHCNKTAQLLLGKSRDEIVGHHQTKLHHPDKAEYYAQIFKKHIEDKGGVSEEAEVITKEGEVRLVHITASLTEVDTEPILQGIFRDITERKKAELALKESEEKYRTLIENVNVGVYRNTGGPHGKFLHANLAIAKMFGYEDVEEFMQVAVSELYQKPQERKIFMEEVQKNGFVKNKELYLCKKDGSPIIASCTAKAQYDAHGNIRWIDGIIEDITERKKTEQELERAHKELVRSNSVLKHLAFVDSHTGLLNYRYLQESIEVEFQRAKREHHPFSVLMLDLDYFKSINDVYGHQFGDMVLVQFAHKLKKIVRRYDVVVRFGGEEFVIIFPSTDKPLAFKLAQRILDAINAVSFGNDKYSVKLKLSIGGSSYPEDMVIKGTDLLDLADKSLSIAKEDGGNRVYFASAEAMPKAALETTNDEIDVGSLKNKIEKLTKRSNQSLVEAIFAFAKTISLKDHYTGEHVEQTTYYSCAIARLLNLSEEEVEHIRQASLLHDLGKIGISEKILNKRAKLTDEEYRQIKKHPRIAADILRPIHFLHDIIPLIFTIMSGGMAKDTPQA